jgi:hypothetical protein
MKPSRHVDGGLTSIGINVEQLQRFLDKYLLPIADGTRPQLSRKRSCREAPSCLYRPNSPAVRCRRVELPQHTR